ncbi:uncharacterized protein LOC134535266 [Bacillus rossius redtenbacheri]|uniref:uncharacterized protein LOC134535266 n=1 Tax=Bacillus rossius redtenbacheri TaxID=93214 RepID=UPI002FDEF20C
MPPGSKGQQDCSSSAVPTPGQLQGQPNAVSTTAVLRPVIPRPDQPHRRHAVDGVGNRSISTGIPPAVPVQGQLDAARTTAAPTEVFPGPDQPPRRHAVDGVGNRSISTGIPPAVPVQGQLDAARTTAAPTEVFPGPDQPPRRHAIDGVGNRSISTGIPPAVPVQGQLDAARTTAAPTEVFPGPDRPPCRPVADKADHWNVNTAAPERAADLAASSPRPSGQEAGGEDSVPQPCALYALTNSTAPAPDARPETMTDLLASVDGDDDMWDRTYGDSHDGSGPVVQDRANDNVAVGVLVDLGDPVATPPELVQGRRWGHAHPRSQQRRPYLATDGGLR